MQQVEKIISTYPDLNLHWLITGNGNMILSPNVSPNVSPNFEKTVDGVHITAWQNAPRTVQVTEEQLDWN